MIAIGKKSNGEEKEFSIRNNNTVYCSYNQLSELNLPNGVERVYCNNNQLTELHLPNGVKDVDCSSNQLTELDLPNGVIKVYCYNNPIAEITLPKSIRIAYIPLNCNVLNIDEFKNKDEVEIYFI